MQNNKFLIAFLFLAIASSLFWMNQAQQMEDRFSVLRESFSQDDDSVDLEISLLETSANTDCTPMEVTLTRRMVRGMRGDDVTQLQEFLAKNYAVPTADLATGYFGAETERWLKEYQYDQRLPQTGVVDTATKNAIQTELQAVCNL